MSTPFFQQKRCTHFDSPYIFSTASHHFQHHSAAQAEAILEQQALGHNLIFPDTVCILGKEFPLFPLSWLPAVLSSFRLINWSSSLYSLPEEVSYSAGSMLPYQNSSKIFITSPSIKSVCDVNSVARILQVAKLNNPWRLFLLLSAV